MRIKHPYPDKFDIPVNFWGFTVKDIARTTVFGGAGYAVAGPPGAIAGAGTGVALSKIKPKGHSIESHLTSLATLPIRHGSFPEIAEIYDTGVILDNGTAAGFIAVDACDLDMLSERGQKALSRAYWELFKVIEYPVEIQSKQQEVSLAEYPTPRSTGLSTRHVVAIKVPDQPGQFKTLEKRCREVRNELSKGRLSATHITGDQLHQLFPKSRSRQDPNPGLKTYEKERGNLRHHKPYYVEGISGDATLGWICDILNSDYPVDVVQVVEPVDTKTPKKINRMLDRLSAEIPVASTFGRRRKLQQARETAEWLLEEQSRGEELVRYGVYIYPKASDRAGLEETADAVRKVLYRHSVNFQNATFRTHKAAKTWSSCTGDALDKKQIVPATTAAMGLPFATRDRLKDGICYGIDTRNEMPVTLDRFSWNAGHTIIAGTTGSGKSYEAKLLLIREIPRHDDIEVKIVDPKTEYSRVGKLLQDLGTDVQIYYPTDSAQDVDDELADAVRDAYRKARSTEKKTIIVVDEARRLLRTSKGASALSDLVSEGRDKNVAVTLITQTIGDFYNHSQGEAILANVPCKILFNHESVDEKAASAFQLSPTEAADLRNLMRGDDDGTDHSQAIIEVTGRLKAKLRILSTPEEHKAITGEEHPFKESFENRDGDSGNGRHPDGKSGKGGGGFRGRIPSVSLPSPSFNFGVKSWDRGLLSRAATLTRQGLSRARELSEFTVVTIASFIWHLGKEISSGLSDISFDVEPSNSSENPGPDPDKYEFNGFRDPPFHVGPIKVRNKPGRTPIDRYSWPVSELDPRTAVQRSDVDYALQVGQHTIGLGYNWSRVRESDTPDRVAVVMLAGYCDVPRHYVRKHVWVNKSNQHGGRT